MLEEIETSGRVLPVRGSFEKEIAKKNNKESTFKSWLLPFGKKVIVNSDTAPYHTMSYDVELYGDYLKRGDGLDVANMEKIASEFREKTGGMEISEFVAIKKQMEEDLEEEDIDIERYIGKLGAISLKVDDLRKLLLKGNMERVVLVAGELKDECKHLIDKICAINVTRIKEADAADVMRQVKEEVPDILVGVLASVRESIGHGKMPEEVSDAIHNQIVRACLLGRELEETEAYQKSRKKKRPGISLGDVKRVLSE